MFSGIGGFELGIRSALLRHQSQKLPRRATDAGSETRRPEQLSDGDLQGLSCAGYSEIDKYAIKVYERQFNGHRNYGDATTVNTGGLPDINLVVGGFPCQAFSIAGNRGGFDDTRGTLFFDVARVLADKRPDHLVLENVKGLLTHAGGKTFQTILGVLADLGYRVEWQVFNSKDFGVPQNRERVYIIGHLRDRCSRQVLPLRKITDTATEVRSEDNNTRRHSSDHQSSDRRPTERREVSLAVDANYYKGIDNHGQRTAVVDKPRIRRLTPLETERLQGFPDNWTDGESDTQRYKMCGNAVTVNVVDAVISSLLEEGCL